ncbi:MAG: ABC transporter permease subunit [Desulfovibrionaceae bacterium]|nr:ABC transporter permease subunit [Desulfovibrionaceae bacterium]
MRALIRYAPALAFLLLLWQLGSAALGTFLLPPPVELLGLFGRSLLTRLFWEHMGASAWRAVAGLALAWGAAFPLGLAMGHARRVDRVAAPLVFLTYPLPKIVLLPFFLTLFGLGDAPRILLIALTAGYQILVVTRAAAARLDRRYVDSFRSLGGSTRALVCHVLVPAALPEALTALRLASGTAVAVLFMAESFATRRGLGFMIMDAWGRGDQAEMLCAILAMSALGVLLHEGCGGLERLFCRWKRVETGR